MIPYNELVSALVQWRASQGLAPMVTHEDAAFSARAPSYVGAESGYEEVNSETDADLIETKEILELSEDEGEVLVEEAHSDGENIVAEPEHDVHQPFWEDESDSDESAVDLSPEPVEPSRAVQETQPGVQQEHPLFVDDAMTAIVDDPASLDTGEHENYYDEIDADAESKPARAHTIEGHGAGIPAEVDTALSGEYDSPFDLPQTKLTDDVVTSAPGPDGEAEVDESLEETTRVGDVMHLAFGDDDDDDDENA